MYIFLGIKIFKFGQKLNFLVFVFVKYLFTEFGINNGLTKWRQSMVLSRMLSNVVDVKLLTISLMCSARTTLCITITTTLTHTSLGWNCISSIHRILEPLEGIESNSFKFDCHISHNFYLNAFLACPQDSRDALLQFTWPGRV